MNERYKRPPVRPALLLFLAAILSVFCFAGIAAAGEGLAPFSPGERLTYELKWGFIPAGEAVV
ncbi:MAG: hypothetical protein ABII68_03795, partial [Pseudomonadota bacterium]